MKIPDDSKLLDDPQFQSLLVSCMESLQRGEEVDHASLVRDYPEFADALQQFLDDRELLEKVALSFSDSGDRPSSADEVTIDSGSPNSGFVDGESIRYVGEYEIIEEIARGGMGVVFKARQQTLNRPVALKMILSGCLADEADIERFQREAQAAGRLKHPNIVAVHEVGRYEGRHYFTMDFVEGHSLSEEIREASLAPKRAARIVKQVAEAVHFAHQQGTLHRDIKPANVLLTRDDVPHVTDFGLAKLLDEVDGQLTSELTATGQILGTPSYMSPEQAAGKQSLTGVASDVYSLGATLYACLTGRAPFVADSPVDTLLQVMHKQPVSPRLLNSAVPKDLETICLKCLQKDAHRRYGTAQIFAEDLDRYLEGRPVMARPISATSKLILWAKRNRSVASLLVLSVLLLVGGAAVSTYFAIEANKRAEEEATQRHRADDSAELYRLAEKETKQALARETLALSQTQAERDEAQRQRERSEQLLYAAQVTGAMLQLKAGDTQSASEFLEKCRWDLIGWEHQYLNRIVCGSKPKQGPDEIATHDSLGQLGEDIHRIAIHPEGDLVAILHSAPKVKSNKTETRPEISICDLESGMLLRTLKGHTTGATSVAWSPGGDRIVSGARDGAVRIWSADSGDELAHRPGRGNPMTSVAFRPDGQVVLCGGGFPAFPPGPNKDPELWVLDATDCDVIWELEGHKAAVIGVAFSPDGLWMTSAGTSEKMLGPGDVRLWNAQTGEMVYRLDGPPMAATKVDFSGDSQRFVVAGGVGVGTKGIAVYQTSTGTQLALLNSNQGSVPCVTFSPDGQRIAGCGFNIDPRSNDANLMIWHAETGVKLLDIPLDKKMAEVRWTPDGRQLLGTMIDATGGKVSVWTAESDSDSPRIINDGMASAAPCIAFGPNGDTLAGGCADRSVKIWNMTTGREVETFALDGGPVVSVAYGPHGRRLVGGTIGRLTMWDVESKKSLLTFNQQGLIFHAVAISPDGKLIVGGGSHGMARVWSTEQGQPVCTLAGNQATIRGVDFSPNSRQIATASNDKLIRIHHATDGELITTLTGHSGVVACVAFAPDGKRLVTGSFDKTLKIWDLESKREIQTFKGHSGSVLSVAMSRDGKHIVSGSTDKTVKIWDVESGKEIKTLTGHEFYVRAVAISPDGNQIASSSGIEDMKIRIWPFSLDNAQL